MLGTSPKLKTGIIIYILTMCIFATLNYTKPGKINYPYQYGIKENYNEPEEMKKALMQRGSPGKIHLSDYVQDFSHMGFRCSCQRSVRQSRLTIISQRFHNERAIYLAEKNGIKRYRLQRQRRECLFRTEN